MTFFCRQPSRLLYQFGAVRPQTSARLARHVRIALPKTQLGLCLRSASNAAPSQTAYPRRLLIYRAPTLELATIGTIKLTGLGAFAMACLVIAPNVYFDESSPVWMAPAVIAVSATLVPLFHVLTRPSVANIFIDAPASARRSKEALISFAKRVPLDTALEIQTLGLLSVPRTKTLRVGELRVRPEGWGRLANLEQVHAIDKTSKIPKWARWSLQRFYARPVASRWKNSRAPEVWPLVLEAITRNTVANMSKKNLSPPVFNRRVLASSTPNQLPVNNGDTLAVVNGTSVSSVASAALPAPSSVEQPGLQGQLPLSNGLPPQDPANQRAASCRCFSGGFVACCSVPAPASPEQQAREHGTLLLLGGSRGRRFLIVEHPRQILNLHPVLETLVHTLFGPEYIQTKLQLLLTSGRNNPLPPQPKSQIRPAFYTGKGTTQGYGIKGRATDHSQAEIYMKIHFLVRNNDLDMVTLVS
ncbi:hypothetical protein KCU77_g6865, partial [Aureobasidium melanogenum]